MNLTQALLGMALLGAEWVLWLLVALSFVSLTIDRRAGYGNVVEVLDTIRTAGVSRFSLQMEEPSTGGSPASGAGK
jgi:hypothetical protein